MLTVGPQGAFSCSPPLLGHGEHAKTRALRSPPRDLLYIDVLEDQLQHLIVALTLERLIQKLFRLVFESGALQFPANFADNIEDVTVLSDELYCDVRFRHL